MEVGTLKELDVKPGDVVECVRGALHALTGCKYTLNENCGIKGFYGWQVNCSQFRIVSRASDTPKIWRDMTDEEKGALLLAHHEGRVIERHVGKLDEENGALFPADEWRFVFRPVWHEDISYRVKPEPVREVINLYGAYRYGNVNSWSFIGRGDDATHYITFETVNGKPDCSTINIEELS